MPENPPRRWWSFSLWQLLAIMTVIAIYCGYQINVVRGRNALLQELRSRYYLSVTEAKDYSGHEVRASIPTVRGWFGDRPIQSISYFRHQMTEAEDSRIRRTFPEARVVAHEPPLEPCHPGCFPHGTLIETAAGPRSIEAIAVGDEVYSISPEGKMILLPVVSIFRTTNRLWIVKTNRGELRTTETQPLFQRVLPPHSGLDDFIDVGKLQPGEVILRWSDNGSPDGEIQEAEVLGKIKTETIVPVINLVLGNREPFIAGGFLARSKPPRDEVPVETAAQTAKHHSPHHHETQP